jgi:hypothetical protein
MGVYNRTAQPYNLLKQFRANDGTIWNKTAELIFWLRANKLNELLDVSKSAHPVTTTGTGHLNSAQGPDGTRFEINSLSFDNKYLTVSSGQSADAADTKSIVWGGWIYLNVDPGSDNNGFPIIHATSSQSFTVFVDEHKKLNLRLSDYNSDVSPEAATVRTVASCITPNKWIHFVISVDKASDTVGNFDQTASNYPRIFINGTKEEVQSIARDGNPATDPLDPNVAMSAYKIGHGPAQSMAAGDKFLNGKLADVFMYHITDDATDLQLKNLYSAAVNGAYHLGSGFISTSPFNVLNDAMHRDRHPTTARSSNDGRLGNHAIHFDDSRAMHLTNTGPTSFPSMLTKDNPLFDTVYNGIDNGQLTTTAANATFGIFDEYYEESNSTAITPFIDSKVYIDSGSIFYQTGTLESVLPGFDQPLRNKFHITIKGNMPATTLGNTTSAIDHNDSGGQNKTNITNWRSNFSGSFMAYIAGNHRRNLPGYFWSQDDTTEPYRHGCVGFSYPYILGKSTGSHGDNGTFNDGKGITLSPFKANNYYQGFGHPTDAYGFPDGSKYKAEDNLLINMSDYIAEPFLVEKIVFEIPGGTAFTDIGAGFYRNPIQHLAIGKGSTLRSDPVMFSSGDVMLTAFLMHQTNVPNTGSISLDFNSSGTITKIELPVTGSTSRHLIAYANSLYYHKFSANGKAVMVSLKGYWDNNATNSGGLHQSGMDANGVVADFTTAFSTTYADTTTGEIIQSLLSGSVENIVELSGNSSTQAKSETIPKIILETTPKVATDQGFLGVTTQKQTSTVEEDDAGGADGYQGIANPFFATTGKQITTFAWRGGPSSINETSNPRLYTKQIPGKSNTVIENVNFSNGGGTSESTNLSISEADNPNTMYLLFPDDKLIFGLNAAAGRSSRDGPKTGFNLNAGPYKITLFGSYLKQGKPKRHNLSQNLQTHTVHESIGSVQPFDTYQISYTTEYTGSFSDDVLSGSIDPKSIYEGYDHYTGETIKLARRVGGRASQGTQGETGALDINYVITDSEEKLLDTLMPNFGSISLVDGFVGNVASPSGIYQDTHGNVTRIQLGHAAGSNHKWPFAFPFEGRYNKLSRDGSITVPTTLDRGPYYSIEYDDDSTTGLTVKVMGDNGAACTGSFVVPRNSDFSLADNSSGVNQLITEKDARKILFGIGDLPRGKYFARGTRANGSAPDHGSFASSVVNLGGFKYGVANSSPMTTNIIYSRSKYGQLRNLLEPRIFAASRKNNTNIFPVSQRFFTRFGQPLSSDNRGQTTCSNLSTNATSSLPFFDRDNDAGPKNRDAEGSTTTVNISPNFAPGQGPFSGLA